MHRKVLSRAAIVARYTTLPGSVANSPVFAFRFRMHEHAHLTDTLRTIPKVENYRAYFNASA